MMNQLCIQISSAFNGVFCKSSKYIFIYKYMTICKTNQEKASIYKCRNLRSNLDCNLFSHIIEIAPTASLTDAAARGKRQRSHAAAISPSQHIKWIKNFVACVRTSSAFLKRLSGATDAGSPRKRFLASHHDPAKHPKKKEEKNSRAWCHLQSSSDKLSSGAEISACEGDSTCAYTSSVRQVLSQPLNPNWEAGWDTRPRSTSPAI